MFARERESSLAGERVFFWSFHLSNSRETLFIRRCYHHHLHHHHCFTSAIYGPTRAVAVLRLLLLLTSFNATGGAHIVHLALRVMTFERRRPARGASTPSNRLPISSRPPPPVCHRPAPDRSSSAVPSKGTAFRSSGPLLWHTGV